MTLPYIDWLPQQRWYAGRNRTLAGVGVAASTEIGEDLDHVLLDVAYEDGGAEVYQVLVGWNRPPADEFVGAARIGDTDGRTGYDALFEERAARHVLDLVLSGGIAGDLRFVPEPSSSIEVKPSDTFPARVVEGEQSNTSVVFGNALILKLFRRVVPGINPDLELNRVLGRAGSPHVAHLMGAIEGSNAAGEPLSLATVTTFAANAADGWSMAVTSTRDLLNLVDLHPDEVGGDFAGEAHRLGEAVASVHATLGDELGREVERPPVELMVQRWLTAAASVPELAAHTDAAIELMNRATNPTIIQRVHGDLHLGQVLRTPEQWILIDFEGEPGQPAEERRRPDSRMRDVAAMLRSFDYAAYQLLVGNTGDEQLTRRAHEWALRNRAAFCDGYAKVAGVDPREHRELLAAYELDKAAYEAAYESRYRPNWRWIPLRSVERLLTDGEAVTAEPAEGGRVA